MADDPVYLPSRTILGRSINILEAKSYNPDNVDIINVGSRTQKNDLVVKSGSEMIGTFKSSANISASYAGVSVSAGAEYSYENSTKLDSTHGIYSYDQRNYSVYIKGQGDTYNNINQVFTNAAAELPPWNENDTAARGSYERFFRIWGTHFIKECFYGTRYQLRIESKNVSSANKERWAANAKVEFSDVFEAGAEAENEEEYKSYLQQRERQCFVLGGDRACAGALANNPADKDLFNKWVETRGAENEAITGIKVDALGEFLCGSSSADHRKLGTNLSKGPDAKQIEVQGYIWNKPTGGIIPVSVASTIACEVWPTSWKPCPTPLANTYVTRTASASHFQLGRVPESVGIGMSCGVTLTGYTQKEVTIGLWADIPSPIELRLFPHGVEGAIVIQSDPSKTWSEVTLPSLTATGVYSAV
ncbi:hypothetical protein N7492_000889 [Penicillium capsulatum]|uniref:MACPF domain-containing protein n=1 Tax=Penicillium capsulatum TaxID=69766 RepID=A0A9W9IS59_9EURO|nr:hypothetical protein N7492_000889 [Penicillium capsulatum]KAJ6130054.1 hypothetical protein N7512_002834 [Penicillium capsulatum]